MNLSETSLAAFRTVDLDRREREVLAHIQAHFPTAEFTRKELNDSIGWEVNQTSGRVNALVKRGVLTEDKGRTVICPVTGYGAHPVRLKNAAGLPKPTIGTQTEQARVSSAAPQSHDVVAPAAPDTNSEAHRHFCECNYVANLPSDAARNKYLTGVHEKRGEAAWKRLREGAWKVMRMAA